MISYCPAAEMQTPLWVKLKGLGVQDLSCRFEHVSFRKHLLIPIIFWKFSPNIRMPWVALHEKARLEPYSASQPEISYLKPVQQQAYRAEGELMYANNFLPEAAKVVDSLREDGCVKSVFLQILSWALLFHTSNLSLGVSQCES